MTVIRCTSRLARRLGVTPLDDVSDGPGLLGDWYANTLYVGSRRYAVCISSVTLLPVIMPLRRAEFASRFPDHLRTSLLGVGVASHAIEAELSALGPVVYAKTRERSLTDC